MPAPRQTRAYAALSLVAAVWGSYPAFAKLALAHFPPYLLVGLRMSLASALLVFLLLRRGMDEFRALGWADLKPFAFLGFSSVFVSTGGTHPGNLQPVVGVALSALMLGEAPGWSDAIGGIAVLAGVALVMRPEPGAVSRPGAGR